MATEKMKVNMRVKGITRTDTMTTGKKSVQYRYLLDSESSSLKVTIVCGGQLPLNPKEEVTMTLTGSQTSIMAHVKTKKDKGE